MMKKLRAIAKRYLNGFLSFQSPFMQKYPPGHFYSPIPKMSEALAVQKAAYDTRFIRECPGIDLREQEQVVLLNDFESMYADFDLPAQSDNSYRYYYQNDFFPGGDAVILYGIMRHFNPRNIIEVGSGFSSAAMLDINDRFMDEDIHFRFIEPYPGRLYNLLYRSDVKRCEIVIDKLQDVKLEIFDELKENDILFVDSSHVIRVGSDVGYLLFGILPGINPGVIIHIHDIVWPFEYPEEYFLSGRAWNELYALRAFLQYNSCFKVLFFNSYMRLFYGEKLSLSMPVFANTPSSSIWLKKVR